MTTIDKTIYEELEIIKITGWPRCEVIDLVNRLKKHIATIIKERDEARLEASIEAERSKKRMYERDEALDEIERIKEYYAQYIRDSRQQENDVVAQLMQESAELGCARPVVEAAEDWAADYELSELDRRPERALHVAVTTYKAAQDNNWKGPLAHRIDLPEHERNISHEAYDSLQQGLASAREGGKFKPIEPKWLAPEDVLAPLSDEEFARVPVPTPEEIQEAMDSFRDTMRKLGSRKGSYRPAKKKSISVKPTIAEVTDGPVTVRAVPDVEGGVAAYFTLNGKIIGSMMCDHDGDLFVTEPGKRTVPIGETLAVKAIDWEAVERSAVYRSGDGAEHRIARAIAEYHNQVLKGSR